LLQRQGAGTIAISSCEARLPSLTWKREIAVFLMEPNETSWDLKWRMFGVHIRVHPMFWLFSAVLGSGLEQLGVEYLLLWVACVFVSVLVHEFGHVMAGRLFGTHGHIILYSFGGLAVGSSQLSSRWRRIAVYAAGPGAGFLLLGLVWVTFLLAPLPSLGRLTVVALLFLFEINLFWGLLNLLPVWPLDGGQITRDFLIGVSPRNGLRLSLGISLVVAGLLAFSALAPMLLREPLIPVPTGAGFLLRQVIGFLNGGGWWRAILFGMLAVQSFLELQSLDRHERRPWDDENRDPWSSDPDWWKRR
jgi:Zn-dependent protease